MGQKGSGRLEDIRAVVQSIDERLANANIPSDDIEQLKTEVDELRLRMWASMSAASSGDPGALGRFRLRRAAQMCQAIGRELEDGTLPADLAEVGALVASAERIVTAHRQRPDGGG